MTKLVTAKWWIRAPRERLLLPIVLGCLALEAAMATDSQPGGDLPLPRWSEQELQSFRERGTLQGAILPNAGDTPANVDALLHGPKLTPSFNADSAQLSPRLRPEDMTLFLPESTLAATASANSYAKDLPTPLVTLRDIPPEFLALAEQSPAETFLIDPAQLVPESQQNDMTRFLEFHARDAGITLYLLILPHNQKLPDQANLSGIAGGSLLQKESCLITYPLGEPWRARMFLSQSVHDKASSAFLAETLQACLNEAMLASDAFDQMHRYVVELSTRLFWLRKALKLPQKTESGSDLSEVTGTLGSNSSAIALRVLVGGSALLISLLTAFWLLARRMVCYLRKRRLNRVWILPDLDTPHRLGGTFAGGGGGQVRYA